MNLIPKLVSFMEKKAVVNSLFVQVYSRWYRGVVLNEIELGQITSASRVLNIGCGGIPYTAIQIAQLTGGQVYAIDRDPEAIHSARRCVASLKLEDKITVANLDGTGHLPFNFDVALVALQSEPKKEILENLQKHAEKDARLVFRRPRHHLGYQYDLLPEKPVPVAAINQKQATFDSSVLYT